MKQRTFIIHKWMDDSLIIADRIEKQYKGQRISVEEFGALPLGNIHEYNINRLWRLAARTTEGKCIEFQQTGRIKAIVNLTRTLNSRLKRKSA